MNNFADLTIWTGDNLDTLRGLNSASVDLIYLDQPFNSNRNYAAPMDSAPNGRRSASNGHSLPRMATPYISQYHVNAS